MTTDQELACLQADPPQTYWNDLAGLLANTSAARHGARLRVDRGFAAPEPDPRAPTRCRVSIPRRTLRDLRDRLRLTRWPGQVAATPWESGTDLGFLRRLVDYWQHGFDWAEQERAINALPQYRARVSGHDIHFIHVRGNGPAPFPLVLTNGWPSSFLEYRRILSLLADPAAHGGDACDAFDVVIPSLPGYGLSSPPQAPGVHVGRIAEMWDELMTKVLGYPAYGAHGSDLGVGVSSALALSAPHHVAGLHLTSVTGSTIVRDLGDDAPPLTDAERDFREAAAAWVESEGAYSHLQRTKPQTLTYALHDSPVGLAAWMVEKYRTWSDCDGVVERRFSFDDLLTTITLYWATGSIGPSMHLYYEGRLHPIRLAPGERIEVPCGVALFPRDLTRPPREWGERAYRITRWTEMPRGGHFPAHEEPELLAVELRDFFRDLRRGD
ncbi:MAG TPA: epoxide hydrolase [Gemmatimonadaceae bacterium]